MSPRPRPAEQLSDALLVVEDAAMLSIKQVSADGWGPLTVRMRKVWRRNRSKAHDPLLRMLAEAVGANRVRWEAIAREVLTAADEMVWPTLAAEMQAVEKRLGKKYVGVAANGLALVPGQELMDASVADMAVAVDAAVDWMMTQMTMALDQAARDKVEAQPMLTVYLKPLWDRLPAQVNADLRRVEFEYVNTTRTLAMEAVDALTEVVDGTPAA